MVRTGIRAVRSINSKLTTSESIAFEQSEATDCGGLVALVRLAVAAVKLQVVGGTRYRRIGGQSLPILTKPNNRRKHSAMDRDDQVQRPLAPHART